MPRAPLVCRVSGGTSKRLCVCVCVCTCTGVYVCIPVCMAAESIPLCSSFPAQHWSWEKPGLGYSSCKAIRGHFKSLLQIQALDMRESLLPELPAFCINTSLEKGAPSSPTQSSPGRGDAPCPAVPAGPVDLRQDSARSGQVFIT